MLNLNYLSLFGRVFEASLKLLLGTFLLTFICNSSSHAVKLGDFNLYSGINEPLRAEIILTDVGELSLSDIQVDLANRQAYAEAQLDRNIFITNLTFSLVQSEKGLTVQLTTLKPISDSYLNLLLEVKGSDKTNDVRQYTALFDLEPLSSSANRQANASSQALVNSQEHKSNQQKALENHQRILADKVKNEQNINVNRASRKASAKKSYFWLLLLAGLMLLIGLYFFSKAFLNTRKKKRIVKQHIDSQFTSKSNQLASNTLNASSTKTTNTVFNQQQIPQKEKELPEKISIQKGYPKDDLELVLGPNDNSKEYNRITDFGLHEEISSHVELDAIEVTEDAERIPSSNSEQTVASAIEEFTNDKDQFFTPKESHVSDSIKDLNIDNVESETKNVVTLNIAEEQNKRETNAEFEPDSLASLVADLESENLQASFDSTKTDDFGATKLNIDSEDNLQKPSSLGQDLLVKEDKLIELKINNKDDSAAMKGLNISSEEDSLKVNKASRHINQDTAENDQNDIQNNNDMEDKLALLQEEAVNKKIAVEQELALLEKEAEQKRMAAEESLQLLEEESERKRILAEEELERLENEAAKKIVEAKEALERIKNEEFERVIALEEGKQKAEKKLLEDAVNKSRQRPGHFEFTGFESDLLKKKRHTLNGKLSTINSNLKLDPKTIESLNFNLKMKAFPKGIVSRNSQAISLGSKVWSANKDLLTQDKAVHFKRSDASSMDAEEASASTLNPHARIDQLSDEGYESDNLSIAKSYFSDTQKKAVSDSINVEANSNTIAATQVSELFDDSETAATIAASVPSASNIEQVSKSVLTDSIDDIAFASDLVSGSSVENTVDHNEQDTGDKPVTADALDLVSADNSSLQDEEIASNPADHLQRKEEYSQAKKIHVEQQEIDSESIDVTNHVNANTHDVSDIHKASDINHDVDHIKPQEASVASSVVEQADSEEVSLLSSESDLDELLADIDAVDPVANQPTKEPSEHQEQSAPTNGQQQEELAELVANKVDLKMDLARMHLSLGDMQSAQSTLNEIIEAGEPGSEHVLTAEKLLLQLS